MKHDIISRIVIGLLGAMMVFVAATMVISAFLKPSNHSSIAGRFTSKAYHEDGDYCSMTVTTDDGSSYDIDYYVATLGDSCTIELENGKAVSVTTTHTID